jgi:hypothetical protein
MLVKYFADLIQAIWVSGMSPYSASLMLMCSLVNEIPETGVIAV